MLIPLPGVVEGFPDPLAMHFRALPAAEPFHGGVEVEDAPLGIADGHPVEEAFHDEREEPPALLGWQGKERVQGEVARKMRGQDRYGGFNHRD